MRSILDHVLTHAEDPAKVCVTTHSLRGKNETRTFREIADSAGRAALVYRKYGVKRGDIVALIGTHHIDFYAAWLGAVWVGAVPTVLAEPSVRIDKDVYWKRMAMLMDRIDARILAIDPQISVDASCFKSLDRVTYDVLARGSGDALPLPTPDAKELLLLQHSSGTTGLQKGVMLSHGAVMNHAESYLESLDIKKEDAIATWLPLYHDMGLIACFITPLIAGIPVVWLSPFEWVGNPSLLLHAASEHRSTLMWLPNFAFAFLATRVREARGTFDLSSIRAIINCSEPVQAAAMQSFADRFENDGFNRGALHACYAMAENVFAVSASSMSAPPRYLSVSSKVWREEHRAELGGELVHVSNGPSVRACEVKIAGSDGAEVPPLHAGRILIRSSFLFDGYFKSGETKESLFDKEGYFDTGDIGFVDLERHLYVTGRRKDLVIIGGRNVYPTDVEQVVMEAAPVHDGRVVCFGVSLKSLATEGLVVLAETDEDEAVWPEVMRKMRGAVPSRMDLDLVDARVVPRNTLRKSTSGKLARSGNREWYLEGRFGPVSPLIQTEDHS